MPGMKGSHGGRRSGMAYGNKANGSKAKRGTKRAPARRTRAR